MKSRALSVGGAILAVAAAAVCGCVMMRGEETGENRVVYLEEFDHYADVVPSFNAGAKVFEWQTGSLKGLFFKPEKDGFAKEGMFPISPSPVGKWTLTFLAWNRAKAPSRLTLALYFGDRKNPTAAEYPFEVSKDWFETFAVFSEGKGPLVGWNVKGAVGTDVVLDRIRVEQGVHRPYRLGDPVEWIASAKPFADETLPADFGVALADGKAVPVDLEKSDLHFKFKPRGKDRLFFGTGGTAGRHVDFRLENESLTLPDGRKVVLTNEFMSVSPARAPWFPRIHARPRLDCRYQKPEMDEIFASFDRFPKPENKVFDIRVTRNDRAENEVWIDGNFALAFTNSPVVSVTGTPAFRMKAAPRPDASLVQKLDFRAWPDGFGLWKVRENRGGCWLGVIDYSCRSCYEAMPSSCLFSVPNRPYVKARALCRVATDVPTDFEPVVVARLTNYLKRSWGDEGGRTAAACAKAEVRLPRPGSSDPLPKGVARKGENLYEVTFDLPVGDMQDLLYREDSLVDRGKPTHPTVDQLDFEFTGVLWRQDAYYVDRTSVPDSNAQSSVVVLSGELEAAPCDFDVVPFYPFSIYLPEENAGGKYMIRPRLPGKYAIAWTVTDDDGKLVEKGEVQSAKGERNGEIRFKTHDVGFYRVRYSFLKDGAELWHHDAAFAMLPKDDRQAGYESPYYSWLWSGTHGTCTDKGLLLDSFRRMGIRGTMLGAYARIAEGDALAKKYGMYQSQFPYMPVRPGATPEETEKRIEKQAGRFRDLVKRYPHTKRALVFHESGGGPFPMEIVGGKTELTEEDLKRDRTCTDTAIATAKAWRRADPSVKLVMGNSVESYGLLARVFRTGMPKELVDFVGEETVGQSTPPEETTARVPWMQREIARTFGYTVKSDCPFEWKCRTPRNFSDPEHCATAFHVRDLLIAHALGYRLIAAGGPTGSGNDGYAQSVWSGAANGRWPLAYPGRGTLASAVLTSVLDCAKFRRLVPTGSLGVYCEEFEVKGLCVYALWTTRGETDVALDLGENASCETVTALGKRKRFDRSAFDSLVVSDMPVYLIAAKPLKGAKAALQRRYPREAVDFAKSVKAVSLATASDDIALVDAFDRRFFRADNPFRRLGRFRLKRVEDPIRGGCIEIQDLLGTKETLKTQENCTMLAFPRAQPVAGEYDTIGVWVEGNMGGGKVWFEFVDAEGEVWATTGSAGYGCDSYDWENRMSINFDGWHLLKFPLTESSPVKNMGVGAGHWQVTRDGNGNGRIDFPVKVTGMAVSNRPWNLDFLEMRPTRPYIRIKDVMLMKAK